MRLRFERSKNVCSWSDYRILSDNNRVVWLPDQPFAGADGYVFVENGTFQLGAGFDVRILHHNGIAYMRAFFDGDAAENHTVFNRPLDDAPIADNRVALV